MTGEHIDTDNINDEELYQIQSDDNTDTDIYYDNNINNEELLNFEAPEFPPPPVLLRQHAIHEVWTFDPVTEAWTVDYE